MRIVRFLCSDGRILLGEDEHDGTAAVLVDADGLFGPCERDQAARELLRGRHAVVADDDDGIRKTVTRTLSKFDCKCVTCCDGAQAIDAIHHNNVDLVVSDIVMPHHDGYDVFAAAKQFSSNMPVVLITGFGYDPGHAVVRATEQGLEAVLYKPFTPLQLIEKISDAIRTTVTGHTHGSGLIRSSERAEVARVLAPVGMGDVLVVEGNHTPHDAAGQSREFGLSMKPRSALLDPGRAIRLPAIDGVDTQTRCNGMIAAVIGREVSRISEDDALDAVLGLTITNNVTAHHWHRAGSTGPWMNGSGFNTFCPVGPAVVSVEDVALADGLDVTTTVNDRVVQQYNTRDLPHSLPRLISDISQHVTLDRGSLILIGSAATSEPANCPPLAVGDDVAVEVQGLGRLVNKVAG